LEQRSSDRAFITDRQHQLYSYPTSASDLPYML